MLLFFLLLTISLVFLLPITFRIVFSREEFLYDLKINICILNITIFTITLSSLHFPKEVSRGMKNMISDSKFKHLDITTIVRNYDYLFGVILKKVKIRKIDFTANVSARDPAVTGILVGTMRAVFWLVLSYFEKWQVITKKNINLNIIPAFSENKNIFKFFFESIFVIKIGYIIIVALLFIFSHIKFKVRSFKKRWDNA